MDPDHHEARPSDLCPGCDKVKFEGTTFPRGLCLTLVYEQLLLLGPELSAWPSTAFFLPSLVLPLAASTHSLFGFLVLCVRLPFPCLSLVGGATQVSLGPPSELTLGDRPLWCGCGHWTSLEAAPVGHDSISFSWVFFCFFFFHLTPTSVGFLCNQEKFSETLSGRA